jgi:hypothetical protein
MLFNAAFNKISVISNAILSKAMISSHFLNERVIILFRSITSVNTERRRLTATRKYRVSRKKSDHKIIKSTKKKIIIPIRREKLYIYIKFMT